MAISLASLNRIDAPKPPRIVLYGPHGVGKNTFAANAPNPVLIDLEDGHPSDMPIDAFPKAQTFGEVMEAFGALYTEDHDFETLIIDSLDWLEPLVWAETCSRNSWADIEQPGYGKGFLAALDVWREYLDAINGLRNDKGMAVIQTAHAQITRFDSPETEPYDRYGIKLQKRASELVQEHADMVLFANFKVNTTKTDAGFNKKVTRGVGSGQRVIYTEERPAFLAKNRHRLPPELDLDWNALAGAMAGASAAPQAEAA
ncbi:ATP-binding protein [Erythrobacter sp. SCSIO 43205]|uniref:ATP-binding protein n=1 Tax=Erythrobacter sp. SCSIO 43205 TaxID=2779361 RepID=UPI001CA8E0B4|nr:ATP-binding protein [Erythrobacter sp. SCSIO 43205]UAB76987.1 ATP-binding protein [Erythrobacter sp. SCSIO 43205]